MSNDNDNVTDINSYKKGPKIPAEDNVPQYKYKIIRVGKDGNVYTFEKTGYLVVTGLNIALIDENNNATFLVANDENLISLEVVS